MPAKPPTKRLISLVRRAAILRAQAFAKFDKRREVITKAIRAGLRVGEPVEVEIADKSAGIITKEKFVLIDNFEGEKTGGWATVNRFDLKEAPKNPRKTKDGEGKVE
jgi:hypothetical protein